MSTMWTATKRFVSNIKAYYKEINSATLTGAIDVVVVEQQDGSLIASPFYVRFGKLGVIRSNDTKVYLEVNGDPCDLFMTLGSEGEAFFVPSSEDSEQLPEENSLCPLTHGSESYGAAGGPLGELGVPLGKLGGRLMRSSSDSDLFTSKRERHDTESSNEELASIIGQRHTAENSSSVLPPGAIFAMDMCDNDCDPAARMQHLSMERDFAERHLAKNGVSPPSEQRQRSSYARATQSECWSDNELNSHADKSFGHRLQPGRVIRANGRDTTAASAPPSAARLDGALSEQSIQQKPCQHGIYLDDLNLEEMDPEVAALYFPKRSPQDHFSDSVRRQTADARPGGEEDLESGRGTSLSQSPTSLVDMAAVASYRSTSPAGSDPKYRSASPTGSDHDAAAGELNSSSSLFGDVALSLCGRLKDADTNLSMENFHRHLVTFEDFCRDPSVLENPNLVVRLHGRLFNWKVAAAAIMGLATYHMPLPADVVDTLVKQHMPPKMEERRRGMFSWWSRQKVVAGSSPPKELPPVNKDFPSGTAAAGVHQSPVVATTLDASYNTAIAKDSSSPPSVAASVPVSPNSKAAPAADASQSVQDRVSTVCFDSGNEADDERASSSSPANRQQPQSQVKARRGKRTLSSEELKRLHLNEGLNEIEFSVTTALQGTTRCTSHVYLWKWSDEIIVSDIDGTITRSDVLGQLLPMVGKDWSQSGVAHLYTKVAENGYKFVYLSARAIGQSQMTRDFLRSVHQHKSSLPPGPVFLSPVSLVNAFHKEVIERKPEEFKISCLRNLRTLFPGKLTSPLYSGFGNKINDVWAYRAVDIPISRIFTINSKGELRNELPQAFQSSYAKLSDVVDHFFPPVTATGSEHLHEPSDYSSFTYWRQPPPALVSVTDGRPAAAPEAVPRPDTKAAENRAGA